MYVYFKEKSKGDEKKAKNKCKNENPDEINTNNFFI